MAIVSIPTSVAGVALPGQLGNIAKGPLSALFSGNGVETLKYPSDLATDPTKMHYVQFKVKEVIPAGFKASNTVAGQTVNFAGISAGLNALTSIATTAIKDALPTTLTNTETFGKAINSVTQGISTIGSVFETNFTISPQTTQARAVISLYMPDTVSQSYDSSYNTTEYGDTLGTLRAISQVGGKIGGIKNAGQLGSFLKSEFSTDPAVTYLATKAASALGVPGAKEIGTLALKGQGYAINPQVQMIYQGIGLRSFSLNFTFTPKSAQETQEIDKIIRMFKYHFAPSLQAGAQTSTDSMFLIPPALFNVVFMKNGSENPYLPKYGDCVLKNIEVNYAPNGWAAFDSGAPVQATLSLQFEETQILDKEKIKQGTLR